jgi:hypothetical protein
LAPARSVFGAVGALRLATRVLTLARATDRVEGGVGAAYEVEVVDHDPPSSTSTTRRRSEVGDDRGELLRAAVVRLIQRKPPRSAHLAARLKLVEGAPLGRPAQADQYSGGAYRVSGELGVICVRNCPGSWLFPA